MKKKKHLLPVIKVCCGKIDTYMSQTHQILVDIAGTGSGEISFDDTKSFMTDSCTTESIANIKKKMEIDF